LAAVHATEQTAGGGPLSSECGFESLPRHRLFVTFSTSRATRRKARDPADVYESADRGWYCFGRCRRGGTIYDLAAPLYGYEVRGEDFLRLRAELRRLFGLGSS
jgi:hypothetical protein